MLTICWAAKRGSGTTVVAATRALSANEPTLLVDLDGDLPTVLGLDPEGVGVHDWLRSAAPGARLAALEANVRSGLDLVRRGDGRRGEDPTRWLALAEHLAGDARQVIVDAGSDPPPALVARADHAWLVTRPCYLSLVAAARHPVRPTGIVLIDEPGRSLRPPDVEASVGAPIVATLLLDPAIARAVDAGLLAARLPGGIRRALGAAA